MSGFPPETSDPFSFSPLSLKPTDAYIENLSEQTFITNLTQGSVINGVGLGIITATLSAAQIFTLDASPVTVLAAKGPNTIILPYFWAAFKNCTQNFSSNSTLSLIHKGGSTANPLMATFTLGLGGNPLQRFNAANAIGGGYDSGNVGGVAAMINQDLQVIANLPNGPNGIGTVSLVIFCNVITVP